MENAFTKNDMEFCSHDIRLSKVDDISSSDEELSDDERLYNITKSNASFSISNVRSIVYGGITSRFWLFRKHMNITPPRKYRLGEVPFYAWECLTI